MKYSFKDSVFKHKSIILLNKFKMTILSLILPKLNQREINRIHLSKKKQKILLKRTGKTKVFIFKII